MNYSWPSACPREIEATEDHLSTFMWLSNKPEKEAIAKAAWAINFRINTCLNL